MSPEQKRRLWRVLLLGLIGVLLIVIGGRTTLSAPGLNVIIPLILLGALIGWLVNSRRQV